MKCQTQSEVMNSIPFLTKGVVDWEYDPLALTLINQGKLKRSELRQLEEVSYSRSEALGVALVKFGFLSETDLAATLAELTGLSVLNENAYLAIDAVPTELPLFLKP